MDDTIMFRIESDTNDTTKTFFRETGSEIFADNMQNRLGLKGLKLFK